MQTEAYIAIGSNLGDRAQTIESAVDSIRALDQTELVCVSSIIETEPVGPDGQGAYLNGALCVRTGLGPRPLLEALLEIERTHGRDRDHEQRWGARTLDLDLLVYGDQILDEPGLCVPHPRLHERSFVLIPLAEIAPELSIPGHKETPRAMLRALPVD
ncbi:MAG: 2-amino-4-hydroxy-6-hydroxymethyldihydropteridine diphosphokinase [Phycisphaerales bacterium JB052]